MPDKDTLTGLISRYSPSGQERPAVDWLVERMKYLGFTNAYRDQVGNSIGEIGKGERLIVLLGHIDTVPGEIVVHEENGCLFGRGSVDAKGPLACFVDAAANLIYDLKNWKIVVIGAVEEERNSDGARYIIDRYHPEYAIIGEPNHWERVAIGYKGSARADIQVQKSMTHTAGQQGSACEAVVDVWQKIKNMSESYNKGKEKIFEQITPSLQAINSGGDGFTSFAKLSVGVRLPVGYSYNEWYQGLRDLATGAEISPNGFPIEGWLCDKNTPIIRALLNGIRSVGGKPSFVTKTGTADLNIVAPAWRCPCAVYGPGDSSLDHTPYEHIILDDYFRAVQVLAEALRILTQK